MPPEPFSRTLRRRLRTAGAFVDRFGVPGGLLAYARITCAKSSGSENRVLDLQIPQSRNPVRIRPRRADAHAFWLVFIEGDYDIPIPFMPSTIVDAGAHVGYASLYFAHRFPEARILAIEPEASNLELLKFNLGGQSRIRIRQSALWGSAKAVKIANPGADSWSFRICEDSTAGAGLKSITLSAIVEELGCIDILKLDIEGAEADVFRGDVEWLHKTRMVILELHERYAPGCTALVAAVMERYGFERALEKGENVVYRRKN